MHRARGWDGSEQKDRRAYPKLTGTWEVRIEHDTDCFVFKLLHYTHNRHVGDANQADTVLVERSKSLSDGFTLMSTEMSYYLPEELF